MTSPTPSQSYNIESDLSENDCRQDTVGNTKENTIDIGNCTNNVSILNESKILSTSNVIEILQSPQNDTNNINARSINKPIEIYSHHWQNSGRCYRLCCFSAFGIKITIFLNTNMILLNSGLIIYEIVLIIRDESMLHTQLPLWYIICDVIVTIILFIEICFTVCAINHCNVYQYLKLGWESWVDIIVLILSIGCCAAYYFDLNEDIDNAIMLLVRVIRDVIRVIRCIWFFKMLYWNLIRLEVRKSALSSRGEPFLANKALHNKYKLQINSSPTSAESDQREYKGAKRVDIYDEKDIERMMEEEERKLKQRQLYPQTPSPPLSKTTTPHDSNHKKYRAKSLQNGKLK